MSLSITRSDQYILLDINSISIHGKPSLNRFGFSLELFGSPGKLAQDDEVWLSEMVVHIELPKNAGHVATGTPYQYAKHHVDPFNYNRLYFYFELSGQAIEKLEAYRAGSEFLELEVLVGCTVEDLSNKEMQLVRSSFANRNTFSVASQQWAAALNTTGYQRSVFFEMALPEIDAALHGDLLDLITEAQKHLGDGYYNRVVACCRGMIECVERKRVSNLKKEGYKVKEQFCGGALIQKEMTISDRLVFVKESIRHITHLGIHADHDEQFSRHQARTVFALVMAILPISSICRSLLVTNSD